MRQHTCISKYLHIYVHAYIYIYIYIYRNCSDSPRMWKGPNPNKGLTRSFDRNRRAQLPSAPLRVSSRQLPSASASLSSRQSLPSPPESPTKAHPPKKHN